MSNTKLILIIVVVLAIAYFLGGIIMSAIWLILKIVFGIMGLALIVGGFYLGKRWGKK